MRLTLACSTLGYIFAQVAAPAMGEIGPWVQLGSVGALGYVAFALVGELRAARVDAATQRTEFISTFKGAIDRWHEEADQDRAVIVKMVQTCSMNRYATVEQDVRRDADASNAKPTNKRT